MKRYNKIGINIEGEDKPLMELHLTMIMIMYCLGIIVLLSWIVRAFVGISPNEYKADTTAILEQLSGVNQKLDEAYLCDKYEEAKEPSDEDIRLWNSTPGTVLYE